jgi:hypothetical protein
MIQKSPSEVSKWTYLCEIMSINVLKYADIMDIKFIRDEFFEKIESSLSQTLKIACYPKKKAKQRITKLNSTEYGRKIFRERFLEDHFMTISDLIILYFVNNSVVVHPFLKTEIENNFEKICDWYSLMLKDENIKKYFCNYKTASLKYYQLIKPNIQTCKETKLNE